jgi:hypothetical protein
MRKRHSPFLFLILLLVLVFIVNLAQSELSNSSSWKHNSPPPAIIEAGSNVEEASYVIFGVEKNGDGVVDEIYAKNGRTGEIEFAGTDASTVIQQAINVLPERGKIFIKAGMYNLSETIFVNKSTILQGEGMATQFIGGNFSWFNTTHDYVTFDSFYFLGSNNANYTGQYGILVSGVNQVKIKNCVFDALYRAIVYSGVSFYEEIDSCFFFSSPDTFIFSDDRLNIIITNVQASVPYAVSFLDVAKVDTIRIGNSLIAGNFSSEVLRFRDYYGGVVLVSNSDFENHGNVALRIAGSPSNRNRFYNFVNSYFGGGDASYVIELNYTDFIHFTNCHITGGYRGVLLINENRYVKFIGCNFQTGDVPIASDSTAIVKYLEVKDNSYDGAYPFINFANIPESNQIGVLIEGNRIPNSNLHYVVGTKKYNEGYRTENSGIAIVANNDYIAHGLVSTPTKILLTANSTEPRILQVIFQNSTHFQVGFWNASSSPPSPITVSEPIFWYAEV